MGGDTRPVLLTVGGIEPRKGSRELFGALALLRERGLDPVLVMLGGHSFQDYEAYRRAVLDELPALGLELGRDAIPDETTILNFRHLLERHELTKAIFAAIREYRVTHFCGAPVVLNMMINAPEGERAMVDHRLEVMTGGAHWAVQQGYGEMADLEFIEEGGRVAGPVPKR